MFVMRLTNDLLCRELRSDKEHNILPLLVAGLAAGVGTAVAGIAASSKANKDTNATNKAIAEDTNNKNYDVAMQNLGFQRENLDYQKALQQQIFDREDTQYQRTLADMRAAGISPLAMQGLDGTGDVVNTEALQNTAQFAPYTQQAFDPSGYIAQIGSTISNFTNNVLESKIAAGQQEILQQQANVAFADSQSRMAETMQRIEQMQQDMAQSKASHAKSINLQSLDEIYKGLQNQFETMKNDWYRNHPENFSSNRTADLISDVLRNISGTQGQPLVPGALSTIAGATTDALEKMELERRAKNEQKSQEKAARAAAKAAEKAERQHQKMDKPASSAGEANTGSAENNLKEYQNALRSLRNSPEYMRATKQYRATLEFQLRQMYGIM